jgi:hypothetical protein
MMRAPGQQRSGGGLRVAGLVLMLAGGAGLAYGIYQVMQIGTCASGGPFQSARECPSGTGWYILLIGLGVVLPMAGGFMARMPGLTLMVVFGGVGVGALAAALFGDVPGGDIWFPLIFGAGFLLFALLPLGLLLMGRRRQAAATTLVATGRKAVGTLIAVEDTGVTVNNNPRVRMRFLLEPQDGGPAYEAEKTTTVSRVSIPRAGDRYPVWIDPADPNRFAFGIPETAEARQQVRDEFGFDASTPGGSSGGGAAGGGPAGDPVARIAKLDELRRSGAIDQEEYERLKDRVLNEG